MSTILFTAWGYPVSILESVAASTSLIGVWLGTTRKRITWPWWALSSALYGLFFYQANLLGSAALQIVFVIASAPIVWAYPRERFTIPPEVGVCAPRRVFVLAAGDICLPYCDDHRAATFYLRANFRGNICNTLHTLFTHFLHSDFEF